MPSFFSQLNKPLVLAASAILLTTEVAAAEQRQLLWGDTHLHTAYSSDAYANGNLQAGPDVAYRYARGEPVIHPYHQSRVQRNRPLDFLVVSDHAEFLGQIRNIHTNGVDNSGLGPIARVKSWVAEYILNSAIDKGEGRELFSGILPDPEITPEDDAEAASVENSNLNLLPMPQYVEVDSWRVITEAADTYNSPGEFSALIGWEWSSIPGGANLHRVVVSSSNAATAQQYSPFGLDDSPYPEDLWAWLDKTSRETGAEFTAIPHNSNISKGRLFNDKSLRGKPIDESYAEQRAKWERVAEITQTKGDSETYPSLSPDDEFADFEDYPHYIQRKRTSYVPAKGDFIRPALRRGLEIKKSVGINPYQFGVIGSTDSHTSLSSSEENNFHGKMPIDSIPVNKENNFIDDGSQEQGSSGWAMSASGVAAVWAEDNTRESILAALKRREVYATTGPRIGVRFYAGPMLDDMLEVSADTVDELAENAIPMGGELSRQSKAPRFFVMAQKDPDGANLDRVQIIKGWLDGRGESREEIFDVSWSDDRIVDARGRLPAVGNTVNLTTGKVENSIGAEQLMTLWQDPNFSPDQAAFYYVRVLQIPTARHSLLDAIALGKEHAGGYPDTIQERAYTSSIWYQP